MSLERLLDLTDNPPQPEALYAKMVFPAPPDDRPYVYLNMAATVDGKIVIGEKGGTAKGVGGPTDQRLFRRLQRHADAALLGSATLRAGPVIYPPEIARFVVTRTGDAPLENRFFTDAPDRAYILAPEDLPQPARARLEAATNLILVGQGGVDLVAALRLLRQKYSIACLLCEGGASLNDQLFRAGLADELFLTISPKIKGGADLPTIVTGQGFPPGQFRALSLLSLYRDDDEIYLRYRVGGMNHPLR